MAKDQMLRLRVDADTLQLVDEIRRWNLWLHPQLGRMSRSAAVRMAIRGMAHVMRISADDEAREELRNQLRRIEPYAEEDVVQRPDGKIANGGSTNESVTA